MPTAATAPWPEASEPVVIIVEDDALVRGSLESLLRSAGFRPVAYASARDLLDRPFPDDARCLIADIRLPQMSGLDLQAELQRRGDPIPVVFVTGHGDIPMSVRAMKAGAIDFLVKPFRDQDMLDAVGIALAADNLRRGSDADMAVLHARFDTLTGRERQVMALVVSGLLNKQAAGELGLSEVTVKLHRSNVMRKMEAKTLADLVRMAEALQRGAR